MGIRSLRNRPHDRVIPSSVSGMTNPLDDAINEVSKRLNEPDGTTPVTPPQTFNVPKGTNFKVDGRTATSDGYFPESD